jgi:hypothetical protein
MWLKFGLLQNVLLKRPVTTFAATTTMPLPEGRDRACVLFY